MKIRPKESALRANRLSFQRLVFANLVIALSACQPQPASFGSHPQAIVGGQIDEAHKAVVAIRSFLGVCTGTLISPFVVITAAHCIDSQLPAEIEVGIGQNLIQAHWLTVVRVWVHPEYQQKQLENDLALLELMSPITSVQPIVPSVFDQELDSLEVGQILTLVGFGISDQVDSEIGVRTGIEQQLTWLCTSTNHSDCTISGTNWSFDLAEGVFCFDRDSSTPQVGEGACHGDSGGPALLVAEGNEYIAGINSFGDTECIHFSCYSQLNAYGETIQAFVGLPLDSACQRHTDCRSRNCQAGFCHEVEQPDENSVGCSTQKSTQFPTLLVWMALLLVMGLPRRTAKQFSKRR